jgi:imidazolonepropionase-like amidohydrolase
MTPRPSRLPAARGRALGASALALVACLVPATPAVAQTGDRPLVVKAKRVWVSPSTVRENAAIVVERGMVTAIEAAAGAAWPDGAEVVELPEGTITAGLVLALHVPTGAASDPSEAALPAAVGLDAFDPLEPRPALLRGGITAASVAAGSERLVPGQASTVRIGAGLDHCVLKRSDSLRVNVGEGPRETPDLFRPPVLPGPDDPLPPAVPQAPKTRGGAIAEVRSMLERARAVAADPAWRPGEDDVDVRPFVRVLNREIPLRVAADRHADVARAIDLAREFRIRLVVEGGNEAWRLASDLRALDAAVLLRISAVPPAGSTPIGPYFRAVGEGSPEAAAKLRAAGVPIALLPPSDAEATNLLYHACRLLGPDFGWSDVLGALTLAPARILGVDADVGTIATGRRADFVAWPGDPTEVAARPLLVVSGGRVAHRVKLRDDLVAITAKRVHTCAGDAIDGATVLVEAGKVRAVGARVTIPHDARRIVDPEAVVVPGFIDGGTQVGIRGYLMVGEGVIEPIGPTGPLGMEQPLARGFDRDLPEVVATAGAGVTAVALSPGAGRLSSGVISVVKTGGPPKEGTVRSAAGILIDLSSSPPNEATRKQLDGMLEAGKKYHESFVEYEKKLDEWKKTGRRDAQPREKLEAAKAPKPRDPVTGTWTGKITVEDLPQPIDFTLTMTLDGTRVTGTIKTSFRRQQETAFEGTFENGVLKVSASEGGRQIEVEATVGRDVLTGTIRMGRMGEGRIEATRAGSAREGAETKPAAETREAGKPGEVDDGRPKPPKTQPALDPYRELFADRASAFVACPTEALAEIAIAILRTKYEVRTVVVTTQEIAALAARFAAAGVALAPTAASIREEEGVLVNPALVAVQNRIPVLFRTGWDGDPRTLYGVAEAAVRHGVDPEDALRMITRQTARFLGLLERLGSLERGKDADLVLLTGEPFAPGTRVKRVMVGGRFIDEETKAP